MPTWEIVIEAAISGLIIGFILGHVVAKWEFGPRVVADYDAKDQAKGLDE